MRFITLFITSLVLSGCADSSEQSILDCSTSIVEKHYKALKEKDISILDEIHGKGIDWQIAFEENLRYKILNVDVNDDGSAYVRVSENHSDRVVYMNFYVTRSDKVCRILNFNADEPESLNSKDLEDTVEGLSES